MKAARQRAPQRLPISLVLGSGGARGLAHIGVIRALEEDGRFAIRSVTGASIGAVIGGLYAAGKLDVYAEWVSGLSQTDVWRLLDFSFTRRGLIEGHALMKKLEELVGDVKMEDLPIPFTAVASDIERRREVWLRQGLLFEAMRASMAIPGLFTPALHEGRWLVDGGLLSPLPLAPAKGFRAEQTVAVSLNGVARHVQAQPEDGAGQSRGQGPEKPSRGSAAGAATGVLQWLDHLRARLKLDPAQDPAQPGAPASAGATPPDNAFETVAKSLDAMQDRIARFQVAAYPPDLLVEIPVDACGVLDFHRARDMIALGYQTTRARLSER
jgi:NTE family protein